MAQGPGRLARPRVCVATDCRRRTMPGRYFCAEHAQESYSRRGGWIAAWRNRMGRAWLALQRRKRR